MDYFFEVNFAGKRQSLLLLKSKVTEFIVHGNRTTQSINFSDVSRLVFVCKGNISRSPYAEYYAKKLGIKCCSFGIAAVTGKPAEAVAYQQAKKRGVDLNRHLSTSMYDYQPLAGDLILCLEQDYLDKVIDVKASWQLNQIQHILLGLWACPKRPHIADPYGIDPLYYQTCYQVIDSAIDKIYEKLSKGCYD